jgi:DNA-directed RNA polymerase subunit RPC12/RpoP
MGSVRGYRCTRCRGELAVAGESGVPAGRPSWTPPVLCCGAPLHPLDADQVLPAMLTRGRIARCPRCGYQVRVIVHTTSPPVCMLCQMEFVMTDTASSDRRAVPAGTALADSRR